MQHCLWYPKPGPVSCPRYSAHPSPFITLSAFSPIFPTAPPPWPPTAHSQGPLTHPSSWQRGQQPGHLRPWRPGKPGLLNVKAPPVPTGHGPSPWTARPLPLPLGKGETQRGWALAMAREGSGDRTGRVGGGSPGPGRGAFGWGSPAGSRQSEVSAE